VTELRARRACTQCQSCTCQYDGENAADQFFDERDESEKVFFDGKVEGVLFLEVHRDCNTGSASDLSLMLGRQLTSHQLSNLVDGEQRITRRPSVKPTKVAAEKYREAL